MQLKQIDTFKEKPMRNKKNPLFDIKLYSIDAHFFFIQVYDFDPVTINLW